MAKLGIFMADGCEEIEGLTVVDILRRGGIEIDMIAIANKKMIHGSHGINFEADVMAKDADYASYDGIVLPGGMHGTLRLTADTVVNEVIKTYAAEGKLVSAICAAPSVLGLAGLLEGKHATSYPGWGEKMPGCIYETEKVVKDGNIITSRGMGTAIDFALAILAYYQNAAAAEEMAQRIMF